MHHLFWVQKDLFLEHFVLTIQNQKYGTFVDVKRSTRYVFKMVFKNLSSKVFNKTIHQMVKNALHKFFRMIFMRSQKLTSNNFDDLTWQKKWNDKKIECSRLEKENVRLFHCSATFRVLFNKITSVQNKFPRWTLKCINFFFFPNFFSFSEVCHLLVAHRWEKAFRFKTII